MDLPNLGVSGRTLYLHIHRMMDMPWADALSPQPSDDGHAMVTDMDLPNIGVSGRTLYLHIHRMMDMPWLLTWIYRTLGYQGGRSISTAIG
ncbi:hypothetical protein RRG08_024651 [Elysia crispata]|uniref:Uncharacterized protein n=1 Tax=Elysia crispata TaxID=231223 RepID=A0AAE1DPF6_9GAST|nr:hypothetical protein RRG08_024651 [Elysia crispata]